MIKTVLKISGMACPMCEAHINDALRGAFEVKKVTSSHKKGKAVILSEEALNEVALGTVIAKIGYTLSGVSSAPAAEKPSLFAKLFK